MVADLARLPAGDARRFFHGTYLRTTRAVAEEQMKHLDRDVVEKIVRGNAIEWYELTPDGRWKG